MLTAHDITVEPAESGRRLDRVVLGRCASSSRALVLDAIGRWQVLLNGRPAGKGAKTKVGDVIRVVELAEAADVCVRPQPELPLTVIHEDADVLALDKPAGQPVQPLDFRETGTLLNAAIGRYPELQRLGDDPLLPAVIHRIDADTSGLVLAAKNEKAYANLREQFQAQTARKIYLAIVRGEARQAGRIESMLVHQSPTKGHRMIVLGDRPAPRGQKPMRAVTEYEPLECRGGRTLLRATIFTGVTHQIRCQLAHAGFPILGDRIYGADGDQSARLYLHAAQIAVAHPANGRELTVRCEPAVGQESLTSFFCCVRGEAGYL
ncbi:MAG: RluA family pseudouridine synthase [Verrucomicrobiota bacterium]|nr:RluA family pseudouridine synthase [Verrucomicrobiota bacterium]